MLTEKQQETLENYLLKKEDKKIKNKLKTLKKKPNKKRKVGRPKKRGPKKKRIRRKVIKILKERPVCNFKIVSVMNGKQNGYFGQFQNYNNAYEYLKTLEKMNDEVIYARKYINKGEIGILKDEFLLLEKNRYGDKKDGIARNEFGKLIKQKIINNEKWVIRDKITRLVEETFWVYGKDPKKERKTFAWIFDELILNSLDTPYDIIRIMVYKNKLLIKYDNKPLSMIMCKNKSDSIRMYNMISDKVRKEKIRQIICIGAYNNVSDTRREIEQDIMDLTGWNKTKIQRSTN